MALTKKRKLFLLIFIPSIVFTILLFTIGVYGVVEMLSRGHYVREGIENYSAAASSISLDCFLTVREERNYGDSYVDFVNKRPLVNSFYRYEYNYNKQFKCETVILSLTYTEELYKDAYKDVSSQEGFTPRLSFDYSNYSFCLNDTERIARASSGQDWYYTSYDVDNNFVYLKWINLVGWCEKKNTLVFIGFYYNRNNRGYTFNSWDEMFLNYFNTYNW